MWIPVSSKSLFRTIEWVTGWTSNQWGFAVTASQDGGMTWEKVGDYVRAETPDSSEPQTWTWTGVLPVSGLVRVVGIDVGTGRMQQSPQILDLGKLAGN